MSVWGRLLMAAVVFVSASYAGVITFPTSTSTVVGSVGFIDGNTIGYFWSVARGDRVVETFADPLDSVTSLDLSIAVPTNVLTAGNQVDWSVRLNSVTIGSFSILSGFTGQVNQSYSFSPIVGGGTYTVGLYVTNEVPNGEGSHTFGYGAGNSVTLEGEAVIPEPATVALLGAGLALLALLRRRPSR